MPGRNDRVPRPHLRRLTALIVCVGVIFGLFAVRLFQLQIIDGDKYAELVDTGYKTSISVAASRGEILDRNQIPLVTNRTSYTVTLDYNYFPHGSSDEAQKAQNGELLRLIVLLDQQGEEWNDSLPIGRERPYAFAADSDSAADRLRDHLRMASYATADNCMTEMIGKYALAEYEPAQQRLLAGVRYTMERAGFGATAPYKFASDISSETMYKIVENTAEFTGVDVITEPVRQYVAGQVACHIIGRIGPVYAEEYSELKDKGYSYNDRLGKEGIEAAAEDVLRGTAGRRVLTKSSSGTVIGEKLDPAPVPGQSVILSIDYTLQKAAQEALDEQIKTQRATADEGKGRDVKSGSVVVLDVKNGGVMTCASWPSFDPATYSADYEKNSTDPERPLVNKALREAYPCGSVFKPGVALAALTEGIIAPSTKITCNYVYDYYAPTYTPKCMGRHGNIDVITAIRRSCNIFFYDVGRQMNDKLFSYLPLYGFGQRTGVELPEAEGLQSTPDSVRASGGTWVAGDYLRLAIGQNGTYTPIQLAAYTMMIANGGTRYKTHFIEAVRSFDGTEDTVVPAEVAATVRWSKEAMATVKTGMLEVAQTGGTAARYFRGVSYKLACKTGTAQTGFSGRSDHGTFIGYAPADDPEIAIAVVMENGTSSGAGQVARKVLDAYFAGKQTGETPTESAVLLP